MKRDLVLFLDDILINIQDIESFSKDISKENFKTDKLKQNAIIRSLEVIGEAAKNIPNNFREKYPEIPWKKISGFRDVLIHEYFGIKISRIWNVIEKDLPDLREKLLKIKEDLEMNSKK